jgi:hypothetical protein
MPRKYAKHGRNKRKPNAGQQKFVRELAKGKTLAQAAKEAGYSSKHPNQSGYQALTQLRGRVPELLERHGLGEEVLIEKYLQPLLEAHETKFFKEGKVRIDVEALGIRHAALRTAFELHGSYALAIPRSSAIRSARHSRGYPAPD